jgi:hypothetical protein
MLQGGYTGSRFSQAAALRMERATPISHSVCLILDSWLVTAWASNLLIIVFLSMQKGSPVLSLLFLTSSTRRNMLTIRQDIHPVNQTLPRSQSATAAKTPGVAGGYRQHHNQVNSSKCIGILFRKIAPMGPTKAVAQRSISSPRQMLTLFHLNRQLLWQLHRARPLPLQPQ